MAQSEPGAATGSSTQPVNGRRLAPNKVHVSEGTLSGGEFVDFVFSTQPASVVAIAGIDSEDLRHLLDQGGPATESRRVLFLPIEPAPSTEALVEQISDRLANTALRLWPLWFKGVTLSQFRNDALSRLAADVAAREAANAVPGLLSSWAQAAIKLALEGRPPRVDNAPAATEIAQLSLAICPSGLVLLVDVDSTLKQGVNAGALVRALEWLAHHANSSVIALFAELPPNVPPFDRILYKAWRVTGDSGAQVEPGIVAPAKPEAWLAPWRGLPHPLSEIEQKLAKALAKDSELGPLFSFNQVVETTRGSRPKVDLLWTAGRLVVELDGYGSHGNRLAFMYDRHRDYELMLSGFTVLRLANDEIAQDTEKAIEKIRDLVKLCRNRAVLGG